ncbi:hypothetical protein BFF78_36945 [Streptomyces fodineus]|uniref:Uncharacterized protein n=1 Tax=Streptomyces fodineus TaxID=1904616 RepID=A0A1D7YK45_9ACTN|nr:hypothetical protein [Streptomyces fodineus]AOR35910.1 hypothetical protein BFF78_36945 [Streptomyces fodineus]
MTPAVRSRGGLGGGGADQASASRSEGGGRDGARRRRVALRLDVQVTGGLRHVPSHGGDIGVVRLPESA